MTLRFNNRLSITPVEEGGGSGDTGNLFNLNDAEIEATSSTSYDFSYEDYNGTISIEEDDGGYCQFVTQIMKSGDEDYSPAELVVNAQGYTPPPTKKYGADVNNFLGDVDANGVLQVPTEQVDLVFTGVEDISEKALAYKFYKNTILKSISFPDLVTVSGNYALDNAFYGGDINGTIYDGLTSISLPKLETVSGYLALSRAFQSNRGITSIELPKLKTISGSNAFANTFDAMNSLTSVSLPELTTISGYMGMSYCFNNDRNLPSVSFPKLSVLTGSQAFYYTFSYNTSLQSVSFPALTSQSFGSATNQFNRMLNGVTGCTVHFPSNLQSVIGSWSDVTNGFGGTNTTVLFDLPATE